MQQCSTFRRAVDLNLATKGLDPVEEADQSGPFADVCSADSVVLHAQTEVRIVGVGRYRHFGGSRVLGSISQAFRYNVIRGDFRRFG